MSEEMVQAVVWHILGIVIGAVGIGYFAIRPLVRGGSISQRMVRRQLDQRNERIAELEDENERLGLLAVDPYDE